MSNISEIEAQLAKMEQERLALLAQLEEEKRKEALNKKIEVKIWLDGTIVKLKLSSHRDDIVNVFRSISGRSYNSYDQTNSIPVLKFKEVMERLRVLENIDFLLDDISKNKIDFILNGPDYTIGFNPKYITVQIKPTISSAYLLRSIQNAISEKGDLWLVPKSEGWRLYDFLTQSGKKLQYNDGTEEFLKNQKAVRESLAEITSKTDSDYNVEGLNKAPRAFQKVGAEFVDAAKRAILADVMGLGKSIQFIMVCEKNNLRALLVVPSGLALNWAKEIKEDTGKDAYIISLTSPEVFHFNDLLIEKKHQYTIITFEALARAFTQDKDKNERNLWSELLNASKFDIIGVDEAQKIKNIDSSRSKATRLLNADRLVFLTGTPVMNRPAELFPMLNMIDSVQFPSLVRFMYNYSDGQNGVKNVESLRELMKPIMIRRLKSDVVKELPPINRMVRYHELSPKAKKIVKKIMSGIYEDAATGTRENLTHILAQIMRLKQVCAIDKVDSTVELAMSIVDENEGQPYNKILIGTQFLNTVHAIAARLGPEALIIEGKTPMEERMKIVEEFQTNPVIKYLVCSSNAVQEGLNITAAGTVINNDLLWTPSGHEQFEGRAYGRMSDSHGIDSYYRVTKDSIEEWIFSLLFEKASTIDLTVDGKASNSVGNNSIANSIIGMFKSGKKI